MRIALLVTLLSSSYWPEASAVDTDGLEQARAAAPAQSEACSLMTKAEAAAAIGVAVTGPTVKTSGDATGRGSSVSSCGYDGSGPQAINLTVTRLPPAIVPKLKEICATKTKDGLEGIGDLACWFNETHQELHVFKGTTFLSLQLRKSGDTTEAIKGVMTKALARLR